MKTLIFLSTMLLITTFSYCQSCTIKVFNIDNKNISIKFVEDNSVVLSTDRATGILSIPDVSDFSSSSLKMGFIQKSAYLAYEVKLYVSKDSDSEYYSYEDISLNDLCRRKNNTYYVHIKERKLKSTGDQ